MVDSKPLAILDELINANLYLNHPYRIPVIGWEHEIKTLDRAKAIAFYRRFYAPNNAILVVAGDVTPDEVKKLAEDTYGKVQRQPGVLRVPRPSEPVQPGIRRLELRDARARSLSLQRYYATPSYKSAQGNEAEAIDTLSIVLGDGPTSRLYRQLVEEKNIAANAGASFSAVALDGGSLTVYAVAGDGVKQEALEQAIDKSIAEFIKEGPTADELEQAKDAMIASYVYSADNQAGLASRYGSNLVIGRSIADIEAWPDRVAKVTAADVKAVAAKYLTLANSVTAISFRSPPMKGPTRCARSRGNEPSCATRVRRPPALVRQLASCACGLAMAIALVLASLGGARAADVQQIKSPGGISAWLVEEKSLPIIALRFAFDGGSTQEPAGKEGTAGLLAAMLDQGAGDMPGPVYQKQIEKLAVRLAFDSDRDTSSATSRR